MDFPCKLVYVEWEDAVEYESLSKNDPIPPPEIVYNAGFLVKETEDHLHLAFYFDHTDDQFEPVFKIPKRLIVRRLNFTVKARKRS